MLRAKHNAAIIAIAVAFAASLMGCSGDSGKMPGTYSNTEHRFSIAFPQGWTLLEGDGEIEPYVEATSPWEDDADEFSEHITVDVEPVTPGITVDAYVEETIEAQSVSIPGFTTKRRGRTMIDGRDAIWVEFEFEDEGGDLTVLGYAVVEGSSGYLISCVAQTRKFVSYEDVFRKTAESLRFN
jgi:hypothetical protein